MSADPLISIILPLYNSEDYLKESLDSILNQSYTHFELLILNDGSGDSSEAICHSYNDPRINYYFHENMGLAETLNKGLALSKGKYIARQDSDDISHKNRLEKQVNYLENNPSVILLGTRAKVFSDSLNYIKLHHHATHPAILRFDLMFDNPFVHSSVMFRKAELEKVGNYNTDRSFFEDYELWSRCAEKGNLANLPDVLLDYRHHDKGLSKGTSYYKEDAVYNQSIQNIEKLMGQKKEVYQELSALYHWKTERCKGLSKRELFSGLKDIADKITKLYPGDKALILKRLEQYKKIILYRLNINQRRKYPDDKLKLFFLKVENKLMGLHANVINE